MYNSGKKIAIINGSVRCFRIFLFFAGIAIIFAACSKDEEELKKDSPPKETSPGEGNQGGGQDTIMAPADSLDADVVSEHLLLPSASKITGKPPTATDGQIKMDVKDTIYLVKGLPIGEMIAFWHTPTQIVSGFYVYVSGSSFYYDVPKTVIDEQFIPAAENDSISLLTVDISNGAWEYPFSTNIQILPHGPDGIPLDDATRPIEVEDPANSCTSIIRTISPDNRKLWMWEKTTLSYNGILNTTWAPWVPTRVQSIGAGCCWISRNSSVFVGYPGCKKNTTSPDMAYKELPLDANITRYFEAMNILEAKKLSFFGYESKKEWDQNNTDFCSEIPAYKHDGDVYSDGANSTHDFAPGAKSMNMSVPIWNGSWRPPTHVNLVYTCNTLVMKWEESEGAEWSKIYKKWNAENDPVNNWPNQYDLWFD